MASKVKLKKKLFIFDLDGTLADVYTAIEESLNFTRQVLGYQKISYAVVKKSVGRGDKLFIEEFFKPDDVRKALRLFRNHHKESVVRDSRLMPYAKELLKVLKRKGKYTAIASNRSTIFTKHILKALNIDGYIDYVLCADRAKEIKPHPGMLKSVLKRFKITPEDAVYIGDMAIDLEAAYRAGVDSVFVKGGSGRIKDAKTYKNAILVSSLKEILDYYE